MRGNSSSLDFFTSIIFFWLFMEELASLGAFPDAEAQSAYSFQHLIQLPPIGAHLGSRQLI